MPRSSGFGLVLPAALAAVALAAMRGGAPAAQARPDGTPAAWDLLSLAAADTGSARAHRVTTLTNFGEQRRVVATPVPYRLAYPVEIPEASFLDLGLAIQARIFTVDFVPKAGPTRFKVVFTDESGAERVLHERIVDLRGREEDRRWFDERVDLAPIAGRTGTLALVVERADDPAASAETTALFAAPRVVRKGPPAGPNLLFVTIDCLRADHVGAYGYSRATTPAIDRLAAEGIRFAHAYTGAPMTLPSLPQIFTSNAFPVPGLETFVGPFARAGMPTAAIVNNVWLVLWLARSSVPFDALVSGELMAEQITDQALRWLERHADQRFALYLHYLDAHTPYGGPKHYARLFADPGYAGPIGDGFADVEAAASGKLDEADRERLVALYDGQIRLVDDQLARLLESLRARGLLDSTIVVVSADHGEELWEHGRFFHGQSLYDELLHVPLVVRLPGGEKAGTVVERPVRSIDIAPALLEWSGLERPGSFAGRSLAEAIARPDAPGDALVATATMGQFPTRYALRTGEMKLVETVDTGERQLFDLAADPKETRNLLAERPEQARELAAALESARAPLEHEGVQLRIVGPKQGKASFRLALKSVSDSGVFETIDRTTTTTTAAAAATPDTRVSLSSDGKSLFLKGEVDAQGRGFRFDRRRLLLAALAGKPDPLRATLAVDGRLAPPGAVVLGSGAALGANRSFETSAAKMEVTGDPGCPPPDEGVRVCLWRGAAERAREPTPIAPPVGDAAARERLRALGYVQ